MSIYDSLGFDTELGEPAENRRANLAPGCPKGFALMGITGAVAMKLKCAEGAETVWVLY